MANLSIRNLPQEWIFPTTRYQGSKRKILPWIWSKIKDLSFDSALDLFGGTALLSLLLKRMGKQVTFNDYLRYNYLTGVAFIQNSNSILTEDDLDFILKKRHGVTYTGFIAQTFKGYYFLDKENKWLDRTIANISGLNRMYSGETLEYKQALATWCLGQACLIKRPFNLFHRRNLNLRTKKLRRSFGNKVTWETPFPLAIRRFAEEANQSIFDNKHKNDALCQDAFKFRQNYYDLVYLDPPYFFKNQRETDYREMYHFLEGITQYERWPELIDYTSYNLRLKRDVMRWPSRSTKALEELYSEIIDRFKDSILVISHKLGSLLPIETINQILIEHGKDISLYQKPYVYALSKNNGNPKHNVECLIIAL